MQTVGFIGCGNMGSAIIYGIAKEGLFQVAGFDHHPEKLAKLQADCGLVVCGSEKELCIKSDIIVLAVKPHAVQDLLSRIASCLSADKIIVSIAAGISLAAIKQKLAESPNAVNCPVVLVMPNTPAMVGAGCSALCFDDKLLQEEQQKTVKRIFDCVGITTVLPEHFFAEFSTLIGSGPAFVFYMLEAMLESAIRLGFKYDEAKQLLEQLFAGSVKLAQENPDVPYAKLRLNVCSPKGTTIAGMNSLDKNAVRGSVIEAVLATYDRNMELKK